MRGSESVHVLRFVIHNNDLAGNPYLNFFLAGVLEFFLRNPILGYQEEGFGDPPIALMMVGGIACAAIALYSTKLSWLSTSFAMVGKFCVTGSFGLMYLYTGELFPTVVRNVTLGSCSMCARIGSILAPLYGTARTYREGKATHPAVPNILYGLLALSSGVLAFLLPETRDQKLPDTLEEGENFGKLMELESPEDSEKEAVIEYPLEDFSESTGEENILNETK
ncbi:organic cation transporter protein [Caerostris extrusa]|uniref:Organic cation transporter protein n=1 Tax=Caerostris extrusa TaxID=172846 RepID=A0AAV4NLI6_CAEEX|nr:organic cation transporter protein [Caerostris extrusa]